MEQFILILLDGLFYAAWVFTVSLGLTLIYGVMRILNIAHGSFYAFGAYGAASSLTFYFKGEWPPGLKSLAEKVELYFDATDPSFPFQFKYVFLLLLAIILIYFFTKLITSRYYIRMLKALAALPIAIGYIFLEIKFLWPLLIQDTTSFKFAFFNNEQSALLETTLSYIYPIVICLLALLLVAALIRFATNIRTLSILLILLFTLGLTTALSFVLLPLLPEVLSLSLPFPSEMLIHLPYLGIGVFVIVFIIAPMLTAQIKALGLRFLTGLLVALGTAYTINALLPLVPDLPLTLLFKSIYLVMVTSLILAIACALLVFINAFKFILLSFVRTKKQALHIPFRCLLIFANNRLLLSRAFSRGLELPNTFYSSFNCRCSTWYLGRAWCFALYTTKR